MDNIEKRIDEIISSLTLEEKIGQLNQKFFSSKDFEVTKEKIREGKIGSLVIAQSAHAGNVAQEELHTETLTELQRVAVEESKTKIPVIYGRDVIHGHRTVYPLPLASAAAFDPELVKKCYECIAKEASNDGLHWAFSPMLDLSRDPRWGRCVEGPGEDPYVGEQFAVAAVEGFQGDDLSKPGSVVACGKHYIGYGASEGGRDYHRAEISDYSLRNFYLRAFRSGVKAGMGTVMSSFNEISGQPTNSSRYLMTDVLRGELGFDGFVVSDYAAINQLKNQGACEDYRDCARLAINAGLDMDMDDDCFINNLKDLVESGEVAEETIDEAVRRILRIKMRAGLFDNPFKEKVTYNRDEHEALCLEIAQKAMVLLKNKDNILPLKKDIKIALVGPMVREKRVQLGTWTIDADMDRVITIEDAFKAAAPDAKLLISEREFFDEMVMQTRDADVVVACLGESHQMSGEARSLTDIGLPASQLEFLKSLKAMGKPVIGVLSFGRPTSLAAAEPYMDAILYSWHSGTKAADAVAALVFGDRIPSGKLPMTFPRVTGQIPIYYNPPSSGRPVNGYYGQEEGMYNYEDCPGSPMYPFGYGLSYSSFEYSPVSVDKKEISLGALKEGGSFEVKIKIKNTGKYDADEVAQCYIRDVVAESTRPLRELKGFERVSLKAGEEKEITFTLGFEELAYYNSTGKLTVEPGKFEVYAGTNCLTDNKTNICVVK